MNETRTVRLPKRAGVVAAVVGLSAVGLITVASGFPASAQVMKPGDRVWECHYAKSGTDAEYLVKNNNPRSVPWKSADVNGDGEVSVGSQYLAAGGNRIYVVQINGDSPGLGACPAANSSPLPTGTKTNSGYTSPPVTTTTTTPPVTTTTTTPPVTTTTTPPVTTTTTPPVTTTTTTPPTTTPPVTTPPVTTTTTTPPVTTPPSTPSTPPQTAPGYGPPGTGGAGSSNPANLAIGSGLLLLAGAITITDVAQRRRRATTGK